MDTGKNWGFDRWLGDNLAESLCPTHLNNQRAGWVPLTMAIIVPKRQKNQIFLQVNNISIYGKIGRIKVAPKAPKQVSGH
jgi:hypothetical protein